MAGITVKKIKIINLAVLAAILFDSVKLEELTNSPLNTTRVNLINQGKKLPVTPVNNEKKRYNSPTYIWLVEKHIFL